MCAPASAPELLAGESVAVNGVCLTAIDDTSGELHADIGPETARVTTLGLLKPAAGESRARRCAPTAVRRPFVLGHVDGTA